MVDRKSWCVVGASGMLGSRLVRELRDLGCLVTAVTCQHNLPEASRGVNVTVLKADLVADNAVKEIVSLSKPDVLVNCVGLTSVDACEDHLEMAKLLNCELVGQLASAANSIKARFVHISTDHLWSGVDPMIREDVAIKPVNVYARTKADGERAALSNCLDTLILRTNFFGCSLPWRNSFDQWALDELQAGRQVNAFGDVYFTPISAALLVGKIIALVKLEARGVYNVAGCERLSKYDFVLRLAKRYGMDENLIRRASIEEINLRAPRPKDMSLDTSKVSALLGAKMPTFNESLDSINQLRSDHSNQY
ncbi:SDR family oxidoreductase [Thalassospira sp.]|uniref:SDR family oxidoreductase n=1 Tax=Thalassospira sp. TaxID=1912094 RepID=UPI0032EB0931